MKWISDVSISTGHFIRVLTFIVHASATHLVAVKRLTSLNWVPHKSLSVCIHKVRMRLFQSVVYIGLHKHASWWDDTPLFIWKGNFSGKGKDHILINTDKFLYRNSNICRAWLLQVYTPYRYTLRVCYSASVCSMTVAMLKPAASLHWGWPWIRMPSFRAPLIKNSTLSVVYSKANALPSHPSVWYHLFLFYLCIGAAPRKMIRSTELFAELDSVLFYFVAET